jgi:hypothetical protein
MLLSLPYFDRDLLLQTLSSSSPQRFAFPIAAISSTLSQKLLTTSSRFVFKEKEKLSTRKLYLPSLRKERASYAHARAHSVVERRTVLVLHSCSAEIRIARGT